MKAHHQMRYLSSMLLFVVSVMTMISCKNEKEMPEPDYEAAMAPGVNALTFVNGVASTNVSQGDIVAVFSTASNTEQTFAYTIHGNLAKSIQIIDHQKTASVGSPYKPMAYRSQSNFRQSSISYSDNG